MPDCELFTIGHSTRALDELVTLLHAYDIELLVDVRTAAGSRRHPQFNADNLAQQLPATGIAYKRASGLGGWRRPDPNSINTAWRNASFRGFADYMQTPQFAEALDALIADAETSRVAIMCAEAVPWRCHRSLIADALVARNCTVRHITSPSRAQPHQLTPFAKIEEGRVTYPALL